MWGVCLPLFVCQTLVVINFYGLVEEFLKLKMRLICAFPADYAEVDILEEEDISESGAARFNLEWMQKVVYTIKPAIEQ